MILEGSFLSQAFKVILALLVIGGFIYVGPYKSYLKKKAKKEAAEKAANTNTSKEGE